MELPSPLCLAFYVIFFVVPLVMMIINRVVVLYKIKIYTQSFSYLFFSKDMKWPTEPCAGAAFDKALAAATGKVERKTFILLRHGESTWNETFNRGFAPASFIPRALHAILTETYLFLAGVKDSWFYDSPLTNEGIEQAEEFRTFLKASKGAASQEGEKLVPVMRGDDPSKCLLVSSNLRRALSTAAVALYDRLEANEEKLRVTSLLQEISRNPDTLCITPPKEEPVPSWIERAYKPLDIKKIYSKHTDMRDNAGNKPVSSRGITRIKEFVAWAFKEAGSAEHVVVSGHSLYFRHMFRTFLPSSSTSKGKTNKIHNGGAVAFTLERVPCKEGGINGFAYRMDPDSIVEVYRGFA
mmetsp:Transcript_7258/g.30880  ORF Transcript_7258/g.30880 Transcript_7258/m.30880 type:complete len:354 (+) Transcript_7258:60-1121(+)|eukprot:CAMPEP_0114621932 /NCGR_PEP_ID=MMETSP0168-20121206/9478_1 /TAXON_ID=95228 ORGANISM="Vannella sp., Strain DIVA3 517/6/12" /NCGR_SAMPLE_ID=MMETSP0168 /ASSEMBLY_ACC=CAM_ASM_000044 /LENGTH=353 /DNA_ID=CAMNT_0001833135 /DNA_START=38 /DNA_END=1099 /DNA_ORIENTATION=-